MDINMPVMDGIEATKLIKHLPDAPPVIMVTAYTAYDIKEQAANSGCNDYIQKPIVKHDYIRRIKKLVPL
jgi:CheY-like chemotaxis protein